MSEGTVSRSDLFPLVGYGRSQSVDPYRFDGRLFESEGKRVELLLSESVFEVDFIIGEIDHLSPNLARVLLADCLLNVCHMHDIDLGLLFSLSIFFLLPLEHIEGTLLCESPLFENELAFFSEVFLGVFVDSEVLFGSVNE